MQKGGKKFDERPGGGRQKREKLFLPCVMFLRNMLLLSRFLRGFALLLLISFPGGSFWGQLTVDKLSKRSPLLGSQKEKRRYAANLL